MNGLEKLSSFNQQAIPIPNHVARKAGLEVQQRIDALKIGQKMQDLPEHLWHKSFKYYVKEDPTRQGGPNMRMIRLNPAKPSLTVTGYIFNKFVHPFENRFITVREAARLQGFPDNLKLEGSLTSTQLQIGNAVPVPLATAVFKSVFQSAKTSSQAKHKLKALSLFSGAGGLDIGLESVTDFPISIETKLAIDLWQDACKTLDGYYQGRCKVLATDILSLQNPLQNWQELTGEIEPPDLIFGGPPCQAFSQAGRQKGLEDKRGQLIFEFLRFVETLKPRFFVMENVSNLRGIDSGSLEKQITNKMRELGYNVSSGVLLAANFGAPQLRNRLFFLGSRQDQNLLAWPEPTHSEIPSLLYTKPYVTVAEAFAGLPKAIFSDQQ